MSPTTHFQLSWWTDPMKITLHAATNDPLLITFIFGQHAWSYISLKHSKASEDIVNHSCWKCVSKNIYFLCKLNPKSAMGRSIDILQCNSLLMLFMDRQFSFQKKYKQWLNDHSSYGHHAYMIIIWSWFHLL